MATHDSISIHPQHPLSTLAPSSRTFIFCVLAAATFLFLSTPSYYFSPPEAEVQPSVVGWRERAERLQNPESWQPKRKDLVFAVIQGAQVEHFALTLALFGPNLGVDASGNVFVLKDTDFSTLSSLASQTLELPKAGNFRNTWIIRRPTTLQPIERLLVSTSERGVVETGVQGYNDEGEYELEQPVGDITALPPLLQDLFGSILKARNGYDPQSRDNAVLNKALNVLGNE